MSKRFVFVTIFASITLLVLLNFAQYLRGGNTVSHGWAEYGMPFTMYEDAQTLSRGRFLYLGMLANIAVACATGLIASYILNRLFRTR